MAIRGRSWSARWTRHEIQTLLGQILGQGANRLTRMLGMDCFRGHEGVWADSVPSQRKACDGAPRRTGI